MMTSAKNAKSEEETAGYVAMLVIAGTTWSVSVSTSCLKNMKNTTAPIA